MSVAIGLDVGTSGVKALAVSETGEVLGRAEEEYPLSTPRPGWAEQDPEDWWRATERALARLDVREPAGIGLSGQMHGLVALDAAERAHGLVAAACRDEHVALRRAGCLRGLVDR